MDVPLCAACAGLLGRPRRCEDGAPRLDRLDGLPVLPVWALAPYAGPVRGLVVAWKDRGRADLARPLGDAVARAARELAGPLRRALGGARGDPTGGGRGPGLVVVPAPSTWAARLERGRVPVRELAVRAAEALGSSGLDAEVVDALAERRGRDQVGLGARARAANVRDRVRARRSAARCAGRPVLLVDDVLTTGATLATCEAVLARRGVVVVGALVLAATPRPADRTPRRPT
ncbi:ComF family protein [Luteimicrobium sp. NPDC057192]|uniref:ComF family protein n=1 Tax=Luteimicrobium sp. NPDC057192 TaxID=3346042 RepID=UPI003630A8C2